MQKSSRCPGSSPSRIPRPSIERLCRVFGALEELEREGVAAVSSSRIGEKLSIPGHTVRKDVNFLGELGPSRLGYAVAGLKGLIQRRLKLAESRGVCLVGLSELGVGLLRSAYLFSERYRIRAGFDASVNRLEITRTELPLYPLHMIREVVMRERIELAVVASGEDWVRRAAADLIESGVRGIVNFCRCEIACERPDVWITNLSLVNELRILSALVALSSASERNQQE